MSRQEIIEATNKALSEEFEKDIIEFTMDADIKETLDLDSLAMVDMVATLEAEMEVTIKGQDIIRIKTFGDLYDYIEMQKNHIEEEAMAS